jgi:hypothetical protein
MINIYDNIKKTIVLKFDCKAKYNTWPIIKQAKVENDEMIKGDFYYLVNDCLVLRANAKKILNSILKPVSEFLPLKLKNEDLDVVNITLCQDCLELSKCDFNSIVIDERIFSFVSNKLPNESLFKVPEYKAAIFCHQGLLPPEKDFKYLVESNNLKGLIFKEVWSSE